MICNLTSRHTLCCRNAWFGLDLGLWLIPTSYTLRHARGYGRSALRNWQLQVSKDGQVWVVLVNHADDCSLNEPGYVTTSQIYTAAFKGANIIEIIAGKIQQGLIFNQLPPSNIAKNPQ